MIRRTLLAAGLVTAFSATQAGRLVYEGLPFDETMPPYEPGDRVTITVEVIGDVLPNSTVLLNDVDSYRISDGQRTFTPEDSYFADFSPFFIDNPRITFDGDGNATSWQFEVYAPLPPDATTSPLNFIRTFNTGEGFPFSSGDDTVIDGTCVSFVGEFCGSGGGQDGLTYGNTGMPGTWRILGEDVFSSSFERDEAADPP